LIRRDEDDEQALDVKRHIGNAVAVLAFLDKAASFDPQWLHTHFTHLIGMVKPIDIPTADGKDNSPLCDR